MTDLWRLEPVVQYHVFVERAQQFQFDQAQYDNWILFAVEEGSFAFEFDNVNDTASSGDLVFGPPGSVFRRKVLSELSFHFFSFDWNGLDESGELRACLPSGKVSLSNLRRLYSTLAMFKSLSPIGDAALDIRRNHLLADIWHLCLADEKTSPPKEDPLMEQAMRLIKSRALEIIELKSLAKELHLNPVQLTQKFKARFRMSPIDFITETRLQEARCLLRETSMTLAQIAPRCGYQNEYYFSRIFSQKTGVTPSLFRKMSKL